MKDEQNIEEIKIKIRGLEVPLSLTMKIIEEPYYTRYLDNAKNDINSIAQKIWDDREKDGVKNIIKISADVTYNAYSPNQMSGSTDNINIILELNDGSQKVINTYCAFISAGSFLDR